MGKRAEEKEEKTQRHRKAKEFGQNIVIDLEFADLMTNSEIHSLVQQVRFNFIVLKFKTFSFLIMNFTGMHRNGVGEFVLKELLDSFEARVWAVQLALLENNCVVGGRCASPGHLWLTGCRGQMENQLQRLPGFDKWIIEKESQSYIEALQDQKENLVYLTADSETVLDKLDLKKIYIVGGLVDRNRWKGLTMKKANEQGIQTAKLPISSYLKMSSSQVLTVNQVVEILLKFVETKDWKTSFFQVIPQRKRGGETDPEELERVDREELEDGNEPSEKKRQCDEVSSTQQN
ncbi:hypothetical protein POTOM_052178 [Populus tomentosa]|uniref:tRNA (guanine(9)-N(1))-methyltransferase n=1 Tax=Populus tomentosa TaxID=118781 RepID=A0A8X8C8G6_POPTO|nr:hypothetical protein POTOM_052178 [Populus tomentosa]